MRRPVDVNPFLCSWGQIHLLAGLNAIPCTPSCRFCRHLPSALWCERLLARCKLGVLDSAGAATCYCDLSLDLADGVLGQANDASHRNSAYDVNLHTSGMNYPTTGSVARPPGRSGI
jgi:hypothetical protein